MPTERRRVVENSEMPRLVSIDFFCSVTSITVDDVADAIATGRIRCLVDVNGRPSSLYRDDLPSREDWTAMGASPNADYDPHLFDSFDVDFSDGSE